MNPVHFHLLLNHVPIVATFIGTLVCIASFIFKDQNVRKIGLGLFVLSALVAIPVYLTGESAEEAIEHLPGINENLIDKHQDAAAIFIWLISALGVVALFALVTDVLKRNFSAKFAHAIALIVSVVVLVMAYQLGNSGGQIRHSEITTSAQSNFIEEQDSD